MTASLDGKVQSMLRNSRQAKVTALQFRRPTDLPATALIIVSFLCVSAVNGQDTGSRSAGSLASTVAKQQSLPANVMAGLQPHPAATNQAMVNDYKITILDDMIPGRRTVSEWGFSALIEITSAGRRLQALPVRHGRQSANRSGKRQDSEYQHLRHSGRHPQPQPR